MKSALVITPSIAKPELEQAIDSVKMQTYKNLKHLIVADGPQHVSNVIDFADQVSLEEGKIRVNYAPCNTGANGFYGHRIYAGYPHLVDEDYILFLDEDNWWDPEHVESLINMLEKYSLEWTYSFRKVYWEDKMWEDKCESIGAWPIWFTQERTDKDFLVDTSAYCFRRDWLINHSYLWHYGWGGDRRFFRCVKDSSKYGATTLHTLNYRLPDMNKAYGGMLDFFERGNEAVKKYYGGEFPWQNTKT